ncbi:MAG: hypothetical protein M9955_13480 [Rhizobiaceae bacterium]|nr:hypothetical protein [Rhizobiaceae bacterium]
MDTQLKDYLVTDKAGHFVASVRNPGEGKTVQLTPEQALFALSMGQLVDPNAQPRKEKKKGKAAPAETPSGEGA